MIIDPRFECGSCAGRYDSNGNDIPHCLTDRGCPVDKALGDGVASDYEINYMAIIGFVLIAAVALFIAFKSYAKKDIAG